MNTKPTSLSFIEREEISKGIYTFESFSQTAHRLERSPSTISREVCLRLKEKMVLFRSKRRRINQRKKKEIRKKEKAG
jgi:IS30 family transposase